MHWEEALDLIGKGRLQRGTRGMWRGDWRSCPVLQGAGTPQLAKPFSSHPDISPTSVGINLDLNPLACFSVPEYVACSMQIKKSPLGSLGFSH